jgi:hypothetical protein
MKISRNQTLGLLMVAIIIVVFVAVRYWIN